MAKADAVVAMTMTARDGSRPGTPST
jgi:hypothetical protein